MFLPSHLYTGSGSDQKVPAPTGSGSGSATLLFRDKTINEKLGIDYSIVRDSF